MTAALIPIALLTACRDKPAGDTGQPPQGAYSGAADSGTGGAGAANGGADGDAGAGGAVDTADSARPGDTGGSAETAPEALDGAIAVAANPYNPFSAVVTVSLDHDAVVYISYGEGAYTHQTPAVEVLADQPAELLVLGLKAARTFQLRAVAVADGATWSSGPVSFVTDPLPAGWRGCTPEFTAPEADVDSDEVVCTQGTTTTGERFYFCADYWGEPVFSVATPANDSLQSMRALRDGTWASTSYTTASLILFDPYGRPTATYTAADFNQQSRFVHDAIDAHEVYQITGGAWDGALGVLTWTVEFFPSGSYKVGNGVVIFDPVKGRVLYDYSFHGELGDYEPMDEKMPYTRAGNGDYYEDWTHANTLLAGADEDGREYLLISLKSQDWIFKLYPDTDELGWALGYGGDFQLVSDVTAASPVALDPLDWQYHQHGAVPVDEGDGRMHLLMLDNGDPRHDGSGYRWDLDYSRILQLDLDEDRMLVDIDFAYGSSSSGDADYLFSATCGNTVLTPERDRVLVMLGEQDTMIEVSYPDGQERWRMTCPTSEWCSYRVSWYPSLYETTWAYE